MLQGKALTHAEWRLHSCVESTKCVSMLAMREIPGWDQGIQRLSLFPHVHRFLCAERRLEFHTGAICWAKIKWDRLGLPTHGTISGFKTNKFNSLLCEMKNSLCASHIQRTGSHVANQNTCSVHALSRRWRNFQITIKRVTWRPCAVDSHK